MTVNNTLPFMAKSKVDKRKFIEKVFNLQIFSQMLSNLREDQNKISKTFDIESTKYSEVEKSITTYEQQKLLRVKDREDKITNINSRIGSNNKEIDSVTADLNTSENIDLSIKQTELETLNKAYDKIDDTIKKLIVSVTELKTNIKNKQQRSLEIGTSDDVCPTCLKPIESHDRTLFESKKEEYKCEIVNDTIGL